MAALRIHIKWRLLGGNCPSRYVAAVTCDSHFIHLSTSLVHTFRVGSICHIMESDVSQAGLGSAVVGLAQ